MNKRLFSLSLIAVAILLVSLFIIAYGRGYRPDVKDGKLKATGLLVATSNPDGAQVFINGKLKTATNNTISLPPGWYDVKIIKDGYFPWEKRLRIQGEIVTKTDTLLLPTTPSLRALTNSGVLSPAFSALGNRLVYGTATGSAEKIGVYITDLTERPFFGGNTRQLSADTLYLPLSKANFFWSPDGKKVMAYFNKQITADIKQEATETQKIELDSAYLLDIDKFNEVPEDISLTYEEILADWQKEIELDQKQRINSLRSRKLREFVKSWEIFSFTENETKILYTATASATLPQIIKPSLIGTNCQKETRDLEPNKVYVYDIREDKNFEIGSLKEIAPNYSLPSSPSSCPDSTLLNCDLATWLNSDIAKSKFPLKWLPDNHHLILGEKDKIIIMEYDGYNKTTVYAGPLVQNFLSPWPDSSRLVILTSYNPSAGLEANLYTISLR